MTAVSHVTPTQRHSVVSDVGGLILFLAFWCVVLFLAVTSRDHTPRGQAFVRAATLPLGVAYLAVAFDAVRFDRVAVFDFAGLAIGSLSLIQVAYRVAGPSIVELALGAAATFAVFRLAATKVRERERTWQGSIVVVLALAASEFAFQYTSYPVHRVSVSGWVVPATGIVLMLRFTTSAAVLGSAVLGSIVARHVTPNLKASAVTAVCRIGVASVQGGYFYIDVFTNPTIRVLHVVVLAALAGFAAALWKPEVTPKTRLAELTAVGLLGLVWLHFSYHYSLLH